MWEFLNKNKRYIFVIIVAGGILYYVYTQGKNKSPKDVVLPPDIQPNGASNYNPGTITDRIYNDINCVFCLHTSAPYDEALKLSNSQLVSVWNDWNKRYWKKNKETLSAALLGESSINQIWGNVTKTLVDRYKSLGLE